jgi:glycosyltransferase involved in cell wall biosynthesis
MDKNLEKPLITVCMAAFNSGKYIKESIESILNQTYRNFRLLVINDGSTDNTIEIVSSFQDDRIILLNNDRNRGLTYTRNRALQEATGKYLAILDSDDIAISNRLELQFRFLEEHADVVLCGGQAIFINEKGIEMGFFPKVPTGFTGLNMHLIFRDIFINPSCMMRIEAIREVGGYRDYAPAEDFDLFVRLSYRYPIANLDATLIKYRVHPQNASTVDDPLIRQQEARIIKNMQLKLGLDLNDHWIDVHLSIYLDRFWDFEPNDYYRLFVLLKKANLNKLVYEPRLFNRYLFEQWYDLIKERGVTAKAIFMYFRPALFDWAFFSGKDFSIILKLFRRGIRKAVMGFFKGSR